MQPRNAFLPLAFLSLILCGTSAAADGQAKTAVCMACHGADGNSVNPIWPNLAGQHSQYIVAQLQAYKSGARENASMAPMAAGLKEADMEEIGAFYAAQSTKIAALDEEVDITAAQQLYRGGDSERGIPACMACHGPNGAGNAPAAYPALRGQHAEYTIAQLEAYRDGSRATDPQSMMRTIAARMSDQDIKEIARYISALH
ncbi:MAG: c-type cytochrome [Gammaproteobacteria bacterium]